MLPHTLAVYDSNGLLEATSHFNHLGLTQVIVKRDRKNGGVGIHRFPSIEDVYNLASFGTQEYPLVIQPFIEGFRDIRIIWLGEYVEAYERVNSTNFRHNLHCGGIAVPYELNEPLLQFCGRVMERGRFPYAHLDLMQTSDGSHYLTEINLRGGLRGARIDAPTYRDRIEALTGRLLNDTLLSVG
jgi:ribosomal protein S6--L-glutamate ligase